MLHLGTIQLKGWKQVLGGVVIVAAAIAIYSSAFQRGLNERLPQIIEERLRVDLEQEIARRTLPIDQGITPTREQGERYLDERKSIEQLRILAIDRRGWGSTVVARVRYALGEMPEETRYYKVKHNWLTKWHVWSPVTEQAWQTSWL